jgi:putative tryptophan/tyrosine transport system substrate-binding protein
MTIDLSRRNFIAAMGGAAAWPLAAHAQQPEKVYRIGFLANDPTIPQQPAGRAFLDGLRESGFIEGANIVIERRFAEGRLDRPAELANDLVKLNVELIVASSPVAAIAAKQATKDIPIVFVNVLDPVGSGIVSSLARPGGNITGLASHASPEIAGKRLQLLKEAVPQISRVAVLLTADTETDTAEWSILEYAARSLRVDLQAFAARLPEEFERAFVEMSREHPDAIFGTYNAPNLIHRKIIVAYANANRLPGIFAFTEAAAEGGLMSYGASRADLFRRTALYVGKILKGTKPADLPIELPTDFELVINLKTAKALGITLPPTLLARADEIIE